MFCWGGGQIFIFGKPLTKFTIFVKSDQITAQVMNIQLDVYSMKYIAA